MAKPEIRLKGFEGEWKECSLGDISTSFSGGTPSAGVAKYYGGNIPFIRSGEIAGDKTQLFITEEGLDASSARIVEKGTLLYALYGATSGEVSISKIDGAINQAILAIYPKKGYSTKYLSHYLRSKKDNIVSTLLQGGQGNLSGALVKSINVNLPETSEEQDAIANYLDSQAGETTPRVRFKGFKGERECEPVCNFSKKVIKKNQNLEYKITLTNSAEYGIINQLDFFDHDVSNGDNIRGYYVVDNDDFVYNPRISATAPVGPINRNLLGYAGVMSPLYYVFRVHGIDKDYMSVFFKTTLWHKFMKDNGNSGARFDRLSITDDVFVQMPILYPKDIKEQQRIASYFRNLDKQISLQEQRLEKLKQIKDACLDKMFV